MKVVIILLVLAIGFNIIFNKPNKLNIKMHFNNDNYIKRTIK